MALMKEDPFFTKIEEFRQRLEEFSLSQPTGPSQDGQSLQELQVSISTMLEELHVASEELSQQNEELHHAHTLLDFERRRYTRLFDAAPDAYLVTNRLGVIQEGNIAASILLNIPQERLPKKALATFLRGDALRDMLYYLRHIAILHPGERQGWETVLHPRNQPPIDVQIGAVADATSASDNEITLLWLIRDITAQKRMQRAFFESQARFQTIFQATQIGVALMDLEGRLVEHNPAFQSIFGQSESNLRAAMYPKLIAKGYPWEETLMFAALREGRRDLYAIEQVHPRGDGFRIWVKTRVSLLRDAEGKPTSILGLFEDISAQRLRDQEILHLERTLEDAREKERESLARELHDGPLQSTLGILFQLQQLENLNPADQRQEIQTVISEMQEVVSTLRATTGLLRSPILAHFGLEQAIHAHVNKIQEENPDVRVAALVDNLEEPLLPRVEQGLFRIYQHVLANVIRHGQASHIIVRLQRQQDQLIMEVEDDGVGFTVPQRWSDLIKDDHYGLVGSAERAVQLGDELRIRSELGTGTAIRVSIPLRKEDQQKHSLDELGPEIPRY